MNFSYKTELFGHIMVFTSQVQSGWSRSMIVDGPRKLEIESGGSRSLKTDQKCENGICKSP